MVATVTTTRSPTRSMARPARKGSQHPRQTEAVFQEKSRAVSAMGQMMGDHCYSVKAAANGHTSVVLDSAPITYLLYMFVYSAPATPQLHEAAGLEARTPSTHH
jgi:hypothetical protein